MNIRTELLAAMKDLAIETDSISSETRLREDLEMDSTELVELAVALEKRLSVKIDDAMLSKLITFGELESFLESLSCVLVTSSNKGVKTYATHSAQYHN
jgi:acyl carrier protein